MTSLTCLSITTMEKPSTVVISKGFNGIVLQMQNVCQLIFPEMTCNSREIFAWILWGLSALLVWIVSPVHFNRYNRDLFKESYCKNDIMVNDILQVNQITHWLDSSNVYGSDEEEAHGLRVRIGGLLKTSRFNGNDRLPSNFDEACKLKNVCFKAGKPWICFMNHPNKLYLCYEAWMSAICRELLFSTNWDWTHKQPSEVSPYSIDLSWIPSF